MEVGCGWDGHIHCAKSVSLATKCDRLVSHVFRTALNGSVNWLWSMERVVTGQKMGIEDHALDIQTKNESGWRLGGIQKKNVV